MEKLDLTPRGPQTYSLTAADFEKPPTQIVEYKLGDRITRENFLSLLILSFAISRGKPIIHATFFTWLQQKYGFDYRATMGAFMKNKWFFIGGGWDKFSDEEKSQFRDAFQRVQIHRRGIFSPRLPKDFPLQIKVLTKNTTKPLPLDFESINTISDFNKAPQVIQYFEETQRKKYG